MKAFRQLSESRKKTIFWVSFIVLAGICIAIWIWVFFLKDIERLKSIQLPSIPSQDFSGQIDLLKETGSIFKENVEVFQDLIIDLNSLEEELTEEDQQKLDEWLTKKETGGEVTLESIAQFLEEIHSSEATTMPQQEKSEIRNPKSETNPNNQNSNDQNSFEF